MITMDDRQLRRYERDLKAFGARAYPFATKAALNSAAFATQKESREGIKRTMIIKNRWSGQSIQVEQARTLRVRSQKAIVGSIAEYMAMQEFGGVETKDGKEGVPITTSYASNEGMNTRPRTKTAVFKKRRLNIAIGKGARKGKNPKQKAIIAAHEATRYGQKDVFLRMRRKKGMYKIVGGSKKTKRGMPAGVKFRMMHDLTEQAVTIPRNPWLRPASLTVAPRMPGFYRDALLFQIKRKGLFKGGR